MQFPVKLLYFFICQLLILNNCFSQITFVGGNDIGVCFGFEHRAKPRSESFAMTRRVHNASYQTGTRFGMIFKNKYAVYSGFYLPYHQVSIRTYEYHDKELNVKGGGGAYWMSDHNIHIPLLFGYRFFNKKNLNLEYAIGTAFGNTRNSPNPQIIGYDYENEPPPPPSNPDGFVHPVKKFGIAQGMENYNVYFINRFSFDWNLNKHWILGGHIEYGQGFFMLGRIDFKYEEYGKSYSNMHYTKGTYLSVGASVKYSIDIHPKKNNT